MKSIRRILVAVKNPDGRRQAALDKAIAIARRLGARVELFHAISTPVFLELQPLTGQSVADLRREALALRGERLEKLAARGRRAGVDVRCRVEWDYPPHEAIVRAVARFGADLVIAAAHQGKRLAPWLLHLTDWELLRSCPVPVLILKNTRRWRRGTVLAAVDPSHARSKPAGLDRQIARHARALAKSLRGTLQLVHANYPEFSGVAFADPEMGAATIASVYQESKTQAARRFDAFAKDAGVPPRHRHLLDMSPLDAIPRAARKARADVIVMGAIARSGIKRLFIGNTAEKLLNELPCDVLVVKPPGRAARVNSRVRGMRVSAAPPVALVPV
jgi:universal stress protein E